MAVERWLCHERIGSQFIERQHSVRLVWNYLWRIGPVAVWRKIRSRLAEERRNDKIIGIGIGHVTVAPAGSSFTQGQPVIFLATCHSTEWRHLSLDVGLLAPFGGRPSRGTGADLKLPPALRQYAGWSPDAGVPLGSAPIERELSRMASDLDAGVPKAEFQPSPPTPAANERQENANQPTGRKTAVVFGLGNYAKTLIVPSIRRHLDLRTVHEIDPDQITAASNLGAGLDTCPWPRPDERHDAWFIAGYHHTHADLALRALRDGAYAIVEKPLVTTRAQLSALEAALNQDGATKLFTCFQKRYSSWNDQARADLGVREGDAVDMHCLVYEIPLPVRHWYNWPNSGSRIVSNGCHWIDYFLHLNSYSPGVDFDVQPLRGRDLAAWVRLENGAQLVMSLTDTGSERLGVREVIDLRAGRVTVRLTDSAVYESENSSRVLRRHRVNPLAAYQSMYDSICVRIAAGQAGDSLTSLRSTALMLDLDERLQKKAATR